MLICDNRQLPLQNPSCLFAASPTWTQTRRRAVWCCPAGSAAGSCICRGPPSRSRRGSGRRESFCSRRPLRPARRSGTEREDGRRMKSCSGRIAPRSLGSAPEDALLSSGTRRISPTKLWMQRPNLFWLRNKSQIDSSCGRKARFFLPTE